VAEAEEQRDQRQRLAELPEIPRNERASLKPSSDHIAESLERRTLARGRGGGGGGGRKRGGGSALVQNRKLNRTDGLRHYHFSLRTNALETGLRRRSRIRAKRRLRGRKTGRDRGRGRRQGGGGETEPEQERARIPSSWGSMCVLVHPPITCHPLRSAGNN
jgi:hypothetical protein